MFAPFAVPSTRKFLETLERALISRNGVASHLFKGTSLPTKTHRHLKTSPIRSIRASTAHQMASTSENGATE